MLLICLRSIKPKVENKPEKKIKIVSSNCGGEYYGKYDERGQHGAFCNLFIIMWDCSIVDDAWYLQAERCGYLKK